MAQHIVIIYGPPLTGKSSVARTLAASLPGRSAVISADVLLDAIVNPSRDPVAELEMVHTQMRLLIANYMKNGYHAIVEGPYRFERDGKVISHEDEIDNLVALMNNMTDRALMVRLRAMPETLTERARATGRDDDAAFAVTQSDAYRERFGLRCMTLDTDASSVAETAARIRNTLLPGVA